VKDKSKVSTEAAVEAVLNYGDWDDVQKLIEILGIKKIAGVFRRQIKQRRCNYNLRTKNYFTKYFQKHA
jgi:hypothetical protein